MKRSEQVIDKICEQLQLGEPLSRICRHKNMPSSTAVNNWTRKDPKLAEKILQSRKTGAMHWYDKSIELMENPEPQQMQVVREQLQHIRWMCKSMIPSLFSEKMQQEVKQDTTIRIEFSNDIIDPSKVIDHDDGLDNVVKLP